MNIINDLQNNEPRSFGEVSLYILKVINNIHLPEFINIYIYF